MTEQSQPSTTLVTGLFDLASREGSGRRTIEEYLHWGEFLLGQDQALVCFSDPAIAEEIRARRTAHNLQSKTCVIPIPLEELPRYSLVDSIVRAREKNPILNLCPKKDTALYTILGWSKPSMMQRVINENPFESTHFAWIDFGIAHVATLEHCAQDQVLTRPADRVRVLMLRNWNEIDLSGHKEYFRYLRGHAASGFLAGEKDACLQFCRLFGEELGVALEEGFAPSDEQLIPLLVNRCPGEFDFYYGDYVQILENYRFHRSAPGYLLTEMRRCRVSRHWEWSLDIGQRVIQSHRHGTLECEPSLLSALLDEAFIAAYYADPFTQTKAAEIARYYVDLTHADPEFMSAFRDSEDAIRHNFALLHKNVW